MKTNYLYDTQIYGNIIINDQFTKYAIDICNGNVTITNSGNVAHNAFFKNYGKTELNGNLLVSGTATFTGLVNCSNINVTNSVVTNNAYLTNAYITNVLSSTNAIINGNLTTTQNIKIGNVATSTGFLTIQNTSDTLALNKPDTSGNHGITLVSTKSGTTPYSMALGVDYTTGAGYINAAGNGTVKPICLNTRGGSVGIGTTIPAYTLDVSGIINSTSITTNYYQSRGLAYLLNQSLDQGFYASWNSTNGSGETDLCNVGNTTLGSGFQFSHKNTGNTGNTSLMRIMGNTGNVGIGTDTPSEKLEVVNGNIYLNNTASYLFLSTNKTHLVYCDNANITYFTGGSHYFNTGGNTKFFIKSDGNIGVGTTTPVYKLDVAGTGRFLGDLTASKLISTGNAEFNSSTPFIYMGTNKTSGIYCDNTNLELRSNGNITFGNITGTTRMSLVNKTFSVDAIKTSSYNDSNGNKLLFQSCYWTGIINASINSLYLQNGLTASRQSQGQLLFTFDTGRQPPNAYYHVSVSSSYDGTTTVTSSLINTVVNRTTSNFSVLLLNQSNVLTDLITNGYISVVTTNLPN